MSAAKQVPAMIDWDEVARQVERSGAAIAGLDLRDAARDARILRERAVALAHPAGALPSGGRATDQIEVLAFRVGGECYGCETGWVAQVIAMPPITPIPGVPNFIVGIFAFEGAVVAVLDLRSLLALPLSELTEPAALVVLRGEGREFALVADAIVGVRRYPPDALGLCLPALAQLDASYLRGVAADRTAILDARALLTDSRLVVHADQAPAYRRTP